ncbi:hypothetical protein MSP8887_01965 [Marinomonas spartinae]|uniref:Uncharacterized protein n=2 Tax=Marinomonas spartinae TaxID=1792290 RepID=A0A1A8TGR4_9GAMM|nr:hypothetical protein MSP8886_02129 [Marinomonas spartinae]SBS33582.1 hypothetical protein MSP8887_01965 [Marinomonas spartinae]
MPVNIIYGNKIIHAQHQVVLDSPNKVDVIPVEKSKPSVKEPNVVVSPDGSSRAYLEENAVAAKENKIYNEINRRTEEAPFTVLFTGHIPEAIQEKRLRMMPEIGIFGDQLNKLSEDEKQSVKTAEKSQGINPDSGEFSAISPNGVGKSIDGKAPADKVEKQPAPTDVVPSKKTQEEKLNQLIGGG